MRITRLLRQWILISILCISGRCALSQLATNNFCAQHSNTLYCLTPLFYNNASLTPNPFNAILSTLGSQLTLVPLASPASGIIYEKSKDPNLLNSYVKSGSETFGPVLVDRGETLGPRKLFLAFTYQHFSFSSLDGIPLNSIPVVFNVCDANGECAAVANYNRSHPEINQYAFFGTYGLTSWLDVSAAVPIVTASLTVSGLGCQVPGTYCGNEELPDGLNIGYNLQTQSKSATGIGDVVIRLKARFYTNKKTNVAAGLDVRAPSGEALNFQGSGAPGVRGFVTGSRAGRIAPHLNIGYQWNGTSIIGGTTAGMKGSLPNDFSYVFGADGRVNKRLTVAADFLGDYAMQALRLQKVAVTPPPQLSMPPVPVTVNSVAISRGQYTTVRGALGLKFNPWKNVLVSSNVLFNFTHNGLRNDPVPLVGISYTF